MRTERMPISDTSHNRSGINYWAIAAASVLVSYCLVAVLVLLAWSRVGFFYPGIDYPQPTLAQVVPAGIASLAAIAAVPAALTTITLSIVGLLVRGLSRAPAVVLLVVSGLALAPAIWAAIIGILLLLFLVL